MVSIAIGSTAISTTALVTWSRSSGSHRKKEALATGDHDAHQTAGARLMVEGGRQREQMLDEARHRRQPPPVGEPIGAERDHHRRQKGGDADRAPPGDVMERARPLGQAIDRASEQHRLEHLQQRDERAGTDQCRDLASLGL
ncbi:hypothetical protein [Sphingomonas sp. MA1305]|uniref:hypothetical protein n=1 Tax=Sphingomonas sp. MA1305 TaxID=2479204 RepID=UPI0018DFA11B|nr:hypothetical protein [Sphingomonas sp. MA1305]